MRKNKHFALGTAALLLSTAGFTACSSDDAFTGSSLSGEAVKTQFAINIPAGKAVSGRLSQDIVQGQEQPKFRGMDNIKLIPFEGTPGAGGSVNGTIIGLGAILSDELADQTNAKVYYDVEIAQGVNNFLFYGEAKAAEGTDDKTNGALVPAGLDEVSTTGVDAITFSLKPMLTSSTTPGDASNLAKVLSDVANSKTDDAVLSWSASQSGLKNFYNSLIRLKAGSANSIRQALTDLQAGISSVSGLSGNEENLQRNIQTNITTALGKIPATPEQGYPRNYNLPDGAVQVAWNSGENKFEVVEATNIGNLSYTSLDKFVYPSSLYYYVNTTIKTCDTPLASQFEGKSSWADCLTLYDNNGGGTSVTAHTSSVALKEAIQYAVARLDVSAYFDGTITDNLQKTVDTQKEDGITLDGILIGGQKNVIWDFTPSSNSDEYTIYDASVTSTKLGIASGNIIAQSLALQTTDNTTVNFALELTNNTGAAFTGIDGIVPDGGRFYLVGKLVPDQNNTKVFKQDFTTTAKVKITSLAHAYNCIPDLKNPKLELGLSVDLTWRAGLSQEVIIE